MANSNIAHYKRKGGNVIPMFSTERAPVQQEGHKGRYPRCVTSLMSRRVVQAEPNTHAMAQEKPATLPKSWEGFCAVAGIPQEESYDFYLLHKSWSGLPIGGQRMFKAKIDECLELMKAKPIL